MAEPWSCEAGPREPGGTGGIGADVLGLGADAAELGARVRAFLDREMTGATADPTDLTGLSEEFERSLSRRAGAEGLLGAVADDGRGVRHQAVFDYVVA